MQAALDALKQGGAIIFPTDTVVGLGVAVDFAQSPAEIARIKGRDEGKPIAWLVGSAEAIDIFGCDVPTYAKQLAATYWPGALTLIVQASDAVPSAYQAHAGTIGLRMPASHSLRNLVKQLGCPLATSSANKAGQDPVCRIDEVDSALIEDAAYVFDDKTHGSGNASTVIDCTGRNPVILRQGSITIEDAH